MKLKFFFFFFILIIGDFSARCLNQGTSLKFFIESKSVYLIKIIDVVKRDFDYVYKVKTIKSFKGEAVTEFLLQSFNPGPYDDAAPVKLFKDTTYLVDLYYDGKKVAQINSCSYFITTSDRNFKHDSICFEAFSGDNVFVNNLYFKGKVINGKPDGEWIEYGDSGRYSNGARVGTWIIEGKKVFYKKGSKSIYEESLNFSDTIVKHNDESAQMIYKGKVIALKKRNIWHNLIIIKYTDNKIAQKAVFDKQHNIKKIKCYKDSKVIFSHVFKRNEEELRTFSGISLWDYFYYDDFVLPASDVKIN